MIAEFNKPYSGAEPSNGINPLLKWAGGKRRVLPRILRYVPSEFGTYFEPFLGGGSVFFGLGLQNKRSVISDINQDLINFYETVRDAPLELLQIVSGFETSDESYYSIRAQDRDPKFHEHVSNSQRAARFLYLNKMGFNGLHRVNKQGHFNVPVGRRATPHAPLFNLVSETELLRMSDYLRLPETGTDSPGVRLGAGHWSDFLKDVQEGDFVYLDPPYDPISKTSSFVSYSDEGFGENDQRALRDICIELAVKKKAFVLLSNSATDLVKQIFVHETRGVFHIAEQFSVQRSVSAQADKRVLATEVLIWNYSNSLS